MNRFIILLVTGILLHWNCFSQKPVEISSPDKELSVNVMLQHGKLSYSIRRAGTTVITPSSLGVEMEKESFTSGMRFLKATTTAVKEEYSTLNAKKSRIQYRANQTILSYKNTSGKQMDIIFRVSNDGVAFRYHFPWINGKKETITSENTAYSFAANTKAWLQPMSEAKTGWEQCHPSYEEHYLQNIPAGTVAPLQSGWVYPALFKTNNTWVLITEAGLDSNYCGTRLVNDSASSTYQVGFPDPREVFTGGGLLPKNDQPWFTPWRIIAVGSLKTIAESTLGTDLAPPAIAVDETFIKPGKASWSWINSKDDFITYEEQKKYIDFAADMHWQYCLVDADWDTKIGYDKIKELSDYAATKNVSLLLWYNSAGDWNTVKYHPKGQLLTKEGREKTFSRIQAMGIKGIKVDFFGGDGQSMIKYYVDILNDAAKYKLLVNFHGATLPRGWHKTYPHLMTAEAIYGMEMVTFDQKAADLQANHCSVLPFTRNAFDPMDFTPMNLYKLTHSSSVRKTTAAFELALPVLFLSGIQHYAESPEGMMQVPGYIKSFLQQLPNHWDDVQFIDGYPGTFVVIARKSGNKWYVAGINGDTTDKKLQLNLSSLKKQNGKIFTEGKNEALFQQQEIQLQPGKKTTVTLKGNGGFVMLFE
jgi:hypothetical protein